MSPDLTVTQLLAATSEVLGASGYSEGEPARIGDDLPPTSRIFEDPYGIVSVRGFATWRQLADQWHLAQGELVDLISTYLRTPEPKAWEGYLVLLTPAVVPPDEQVYLNDIRHDTTRVRKLVATGDDLDTVGDVSGTLLPLLPLDVATSEATRAGPLERLPELLTAGGINASLTRIVLDAFLANESILERLYSVRGGP